MRRAQRAANLRRLRPASVRLDLAIDELVLHGTPAAQRHVLADAMVRELEHLFGEADYRRSFRQDTELLALDAGGITVAGQARPALVGAQLARAVFTSLQATPKGSR